MHQRGSIAITGGTGFFGMHLRARLQALAPELDVRVIGRAEYDDDGLLSSALAGAASVVHLAGASRGSDDAVYETNVRLAHRLTEALKAAGGSPYLVYANSIQAEGSTAYGRSKCEAAQILATWARQAGTRVGDLRFPNLFGEGGRPDYNSAVATFCHDLASGRDAHVNPEGRTELLHVQDACELVMGAIRDCSAGTRRIQGQPLSITEVYARLVRLRSEYHGALLPELCDWLDLRLFNALRTAMFPACYPLPLISNRDGRGTFAELARGSGGTQSSFAVTSPGQTRGQHFHLDKIERFVVLSGTGIIRLRKLFGEGVHEFVVSGDDLVAVDMPTLYAHSLTNVGDSDLTTLIWANDHFDAGAPDTFPEMVEPIPVGVSV